MANIDLHTLLQLKVTAANIEKMLQKIIKQYADLNVTQFLLLLCVAMKSDTCERDIAVLLGVSKMAISKAASDLEVKRLLTISENKRNRRLKVLTLTPAALKIIASVKPSLENFSSSLADQQDPAKVAVFQEVLGGLTQQLSD